MLQVGRKIISQCIRDFNAGPAALPLPVLKEIQDQFLDFNGSGNRETRR